jgi:hypothetical protein
MNRSFAILGAAILAAMAPGPAPAQTGAPLDDFKPSSLNQPGQQYPQVNSQGYVRFRVVAPDAQGVRASLGLRGQGGTALPSTIRAP